MSLTSSINKGLVFVIVCVMCSAGYGASQLHATAGRPVDKDKAGVSLTGLHQIYDGAPNQAGARTDPKGLTVPFTDDGNAPAPVNAGSYAVAGTAPDGNDGGSAAGTMTRAKVPQSITFTAPDTRTYGERPFRLSAASSSGLAVTYSSSDTGVAVINGDEVRIAGAGTTTITAYQAGDGAYQPAEPVQHVLIVLGIPRHVAVLPLVNMSGRPAPVKEIRQALLRELVARGVSVLDDGDQERFMTRHRVRSMDGIDGDTAQSLKKETGRDAVLITTLEQYDVTDPPAIAMTTRLVATEDPPIILWMETVELSGNDSPGVLNVGLIHDMAGLQKKAFDRLLGSLSLFLAGKYGTESGRGDGTYQPKTVYSFPFLRPGRKYTLTVAPFLNRSERNNADNFLALHFISQLIKAGTFNVVDPGALREKLLFFRVIMQEGLSLSQADLIHNSLKADLILMGKVTEYEDVAGTPKVAFNVLVMERKRVKIVWASWSFNRGDDGVRFFDWGRVSTAAALASKMTRAVIQDMTAQGTIKDGQPAVEPSSMTDPWAPYKREALPER
jgi:hypothetical protein